MRRRRRRRSWLATELAPVVRALRPLTVSIRWLTGLPAWDRFPALRNVGVPLAASLAFHACAVASLLLFAWTITRAEERLAPGGDIVISFREPADAPTPAAIAPPAPAPSPAAPELPVLQGLSSSDAAAVPTLRSSSASAAPRLTRSAPPDAGVSFAGLASARAITVVYVVDASGAMVTSLKFVLPELERSIAALAPSQQFQVIFFRDRSPRAGEPAAGVRFDAFGAPAGARPSLIRASVDQRAAVAAWARTMAPTGRSVPLDGLRAALALKPDVVFLLSRSIRRSGPDEGWSGGPEEVLRELDRLNPRDPETGRRAAVIKAIQFLDDDPSGVMQAIGREHGDDDRSYSVLTLEDLGVR